jgi:hypothetical protein
MHAEETFSTLKVEQIALLLHHQVAENQQLL